METAQFNLLWCDQLMDGLAAAGVRQVVLSPGSRSTPLVLALNRHPLLQSRLHPDERCAAFFALGMALHAREPVVLIATSGSAPAHWLPAVIEANHSGVPLILLSADRPPELQDCGANQTIDQTRMFGTHVRASFDAGPPHESQQAMRRIRALGVQAVHQACGPSPGPVHINLPFREPLVPSQWPELPIPGPVTPTVRNRVLPDMEQVRRITQQLSTGRGLIVCGQAPSDAHFAEAVCNLASRLRVPLLADPLSRLRFGAHDRSCLISRYDAFLRSEGFANGPRPQWVLRFGAPPVSATLLNYLTRAEAQTILCAPHWDFPDPLHQAVELVRADPELLCQALLDSNLPGGDEDWLKMHQDAERRCAGYQPAAADLPIEQAVITQLLTELPAGTTLFSGNSLPIRQLDLWSGQSAKPLRILANRGASGIDGNVSTLMGLTTAGDGKVVGLLGDLALFHDMNGLLFARDCRGVIVLFNNGGGGIFGTLPQAALDTFESQWLTPTKLDFSLAAKLYGIDYKRVDKQEDFGPALKAALLNEAFSLIDVVIDREESWRRQQRSLNLCLEKL